METLIQLDAFRSIEKDKTRLLWQANFKLNKVITETRQSKLFKIKTKHFDLPQFSRNALAQTFSQMELLNFSLSNPFLLVNTEDESTLVVRDFILNINKNIEILGYLVSIKNTKTSKGSRMNFGTFLDLEGEWIDTVHFPKIAAKYPFRGRGIYRLNGKVVDEFDFLSLEVFRMEKLLYVEDPRYSIKAMKGV